jgi:HTH-type transcriptional regulator / antitoxin HigA
MKSYAPAEVFPPGEFLKDELEARGWSQTDLADIIGRGITVVNEILAAKRGITPDTAQALGDAFGSSAQFWLNLETAYRLSLLGHDDVVSRRARLRAKAPYREMIRRHWIDDPKNIDVLERQLLDFLGISELDQEPKFAHAARKSTSYDERPTPPQIAWLCRARQLVPAVASNSYSKGRLPELVKELRALTEAPENARHVPRLLSSYGIRFLMIEPLAGTKIDGASFMSRGSPVIVLSLRYDRIDHFWHTLMHELGHVWNGDGLMLDQEIVSDRGPLMGERPEVEQLADAFAVNALIPQDKMDDFVIRVRPLFSSIRVQQFAKTMKVHPGIVVGQLQHKHEISYANLRKLLVPVRQIVIRAALTDGWGSQLPTFAEGKE